MVRKVLYMISVVMLTCVAFISCKEETFSAWNEGDTVLSAYKERVASRGVAEYYFSEGTKYRIWVTDKDTQNPAFEGQAGGVEGTETIRQDGLHYINLGNYNNMLVGEYDFYGFTDSTGTVPQASIDGTYNISLNTETNDYVDYRRGELKFADRGTSSVLRMPFKHIMSQVKVMVMCQEGVDSKLTLRSVQFIGQKIDDLPKGVTFNANYNIYNEQFTDSTLATRYILSNGEEVEVPVVGTTSNANKDAKDLGTYLFFPEEQTDDVYYIRVKFEDTNNFYGIKDADGISTIDIPIYDNRVDGEKALHFEQNTSYTLYITFLSNTARIVTLVPKVFEWLDGEGDDLGNKYEEQDLGQPVTFNGVMWSDRNLGATSAHPTRSMDDWYKSVGYFYQYGRNIPYFPYPVVNGNVNFDASLKECLVTGGNTQGTNYIYPIVNFDSWNLETSEQIGKIAPTGNEQNLVWNLGSYDEETQNYWGYMFKEDYNTSFLYNYDWSWEYNINTPCPPGWRLPTTDDYKGIIPGSVYSGNITFRWFVGEEDNGSWSSNNDLNKHPNRGNSSTEPNFELAYSFDNLKDYKGVSGVSEGQIVYKGAFPCLYREEFNDPTSGAKSKYILSMMEGDWNRVRETAGELRDENNNYVYNWGVIYGIKNQGTSLAYRVKWEVKLMSEDESPELVNDVNNNGKQHLHYEDPFRGILVISRYQTSADDDFEPDENGLYETAVKQYDWKHPIEVMYMPVGGFADNWSGGKLGNIGTELWYAISNRTDTMNKTQKHIMWFKFAGTNTSSQSMIISNKSKMNAAVQVRCVRDLNSK